FSIPGVAEFFVPTSYTLFRAYQATRLLGFVSQYFFNDRTGSSISPEVMSVMRLISPFLAILLVVVAPVWSAEPAHDPEPTNLPADVTSQQTLDLPGRTLHFTATTGSIR